MLSEGSQRWTGNEAGMRVISLQDVGNRAAGQRVTDSFVSTCVDQILCVCDCAYLLRQVGEDLCADAVQSLHYLRLRRRVVQLKANDVLFMFFFVRFSITVSKSCKSREKQ